MQHTTRPGRFITFSAALLLVSVVIAEWQQIRIRWLIWRFGKDRTWVSGHLYVDRSSEELKEIGAAAIPYLDDAFGRESRPEIRRLVILTLWGIGDDTAGPTLSKGLSDPSVMVQEDAALAVGKLRIVEALPAIRELVNHTNDDLRETAFYAMGEIGTEEDLPLAESGMRDENRRVSEEAGRAYLNISLRESGGASP